MREWEAGYKGFVRAQLETAVRLKRSRGVTGKPAAKKKGTRSKAAAKATAAQPARYETVWIERVSFENFCIFHDLELAFPSPSGAYEPWLAVVGENGVGKSSFLKGIALALSSPNAAKKLVPDASRIFNRNTRKRSGSIKITLSDGRARRMIFRPKSVEFEFEGPDVSFPVIAFGASRIAASVGAKHDLPTASSINNLFDPVLPLVDAEEWLADTGKVRARDFAQCGESLKLLLDLDVDDDISRFQGEIRFEYGGRRASLSQMSDGFRSVIGLTAHIMKHLARETPVMAEAEGTVLLDEIELHLHPKWKTQIVGKLRELFPLVRFVMTTHDPLCLRGLKENEIYRFSEERDDPRVSITPLTIQPGMDANDILTGGWFELSSTLDEGTQDKLHEYSALLLKQDRKRILGTAAEFEVTETDRSRVDELQTELRLRLPTFGGTEAQKANILEDAERALDGQGENAGTGSGLRAQILRAFGKDRSG